jgi:hypothetical protein
MNALTILKANSKAYFETFGIKGVNLDYIIDDEILKSLGANAPTAAAFEPSQRLAANWPQATLRLGQWGGVISYVIDCGSYITFYTGCGEQGPYSCDKDQIVSVQIVGNCPGSPLKPASPLFGVIINC